MARRAPMRGRQEGPSSSEKTVEALVSPTKAMKTKLLNVNRMNYVIFINIRFSLYFGQCRSI